MRMSEIVTASERLSWMPSNLPPEAHPEQRIQRRPHDPRPSHRQSEDFFGWNYPIQALAILNPMLMMFDYVAQVGSERRTEHLGRTTKTRRLDHHPERPINATDDPERLGSFHVEVAITDDDPPMVLEWSALHAGEPFSTTRVTWMRQGIDLDPAIFTDPRIPAPSLPVD